MSLIADVKSMLDPRSMADGDVRTLLRSDHGEALTLASSMCEARSGEQRRMFLKQLKSALVAHSRAEEQTVYRPLLGRKDSPDSRAIGEEGLVEHALLDSLLEKLSRSRNAGGEQWKAAATVLKEMLQHHVDEEQDEMFEELGEHFSDDQLRAMGSRFLAAKDKILEAKPSRTR